MGMPAWCQQAPRQTVMCRDLARASAGGAVAVCPLSELAFFLSEKGTPVRRRPIPPELSSTKGVVQRYPDENHHADMVIVLEGAEATGRLPVAGQPLVIDHQQGG